MTTGTEPHKAPPPPPSPPPGGEPKPVGGGIKPANTTYQPPQLRLAIVSGVGGFLGGLLGALVACHFCMRHHY